MKLLLSVLAIVSFTACSKSNEAVKETEKVTYTIQIEAVDLDGQTTTSPANTVKL